jgi:hypothetical protein
MKMMMFAENVNKPFAHIAVDATLDWIINGGNTTLYLKEDIEKPFGISVEVFPMSNEHVIAYRHIAMIHSLFKGWHILW